MKLHTLFFKLLVILIPSQLAFHLWPNWAFIFGKRIDYLSPTLYLTDLIVFAMVVSWGLYHLKSGKSQIKKLGNLRSYTLYTILVALFLLLNIFASALPALTLYKWIRLFEYLLVAFYVFKNKDLIKHDISFLVSIALLWTSNLSFMQLLGRGAQGGIWYWLGERSFTNNTPGIALQVIQGQEYIRPYATFPHPNALAGGIVLLGVICILNIKHSTYSLFSKLVILFSIGAFLLARSEAAMLAVLISIGISVLPRGVLSMSKVLLICGFVSLLFLSYAPSLPRSEFASSVSERLFLLTNASKYISAHPWVGVGLGASVLYSPRVLLQPVHNVFLLMWGEIGSIGVLIFVIALYKARTFISTSRTALFFVSFISITGLFDHYWLSLHQPMLILMLALGLYGVNDKSLSRGRLEPKRLVQVGHTARRKSKPIHSSIE